MKKKKFLERILAATLAAAMVVTSLTGFKMSSVEASDGFQVEKGMIPQNGLIADYSFTEVPADGKTVTNKAAGSSIGNAVVQNEATGKWEDGSLVLSGEGKSANPKGTWVSLPNDILKGKESATISIEVKPDAAIISQFHFMWVIGNSGTNTYWFAETKTPRSAIKYANTEKNASGSGGLTGNQWYSITATIDAKTHTNTYYVNGVKIGEVKEDSLSLAQVSDQSRNTIGRAPYDDPMFKGAVSTFRVYDRALSEEEVQAISVSDAKLHENEIEDIAKERVKSVKDVNITEGRATLPDYDGTVKWTSKMPEIEIQEDGVTAIVKQPAAGEKALTGTLTATMAIRGATATKDVAVTIQPEKLPTDPYGYMMVHFIEDSKGYKEKIYLDISRGDNPEQWDRLNGGEPILASNMSTTGVRDPYLTYNPETKTYYILATDLRVFGGDNLQWGGWSWDYSTKISIWESKDLINWSEQRQFDVATDKDGNKLARLGMMWAPEATWVPDYYGEGEGAFVMYWSSKTYPDAAESGDDTKRYSRIMWGATPDFTQETYEYGGVFIDAGGETIDTTIIQNEGKTYRLTKDNAKGKGIYMESTDAKEWWKPAAQWTMIQQKVGAQFAGGNAGGVEGPAMFKNHNEDKWYAYVDVIPSIGYRPMVTTNLDNGFTALESPDFYMAPSTKHGGMISLTKEMYDKVRAADAASVVKEELGEVKVSVGTSADQLAEKMPAEAEVKLAYNYGTSKLPVKWDLSTVKTDEAGTYTVTGTVQSIGANLNQWVGKDGSTAWNAADKTKYSSTELKVTAAVVVETIDSSILADFTFDNDETGFTGGQAKATGAYTLQEVDGRKAMYLNGNSDNYLKVTKSDGSSLLTGVEELTISYDAKPDRTATNWPFYAAPNENAQASSKERYLGILANNGKTTVERYNNNGARPANPSANTGSEWSHVDVVVSKTDTTIYVNGIKQATENSSYSLTGILGNASILQIGKANWKTGEFYKGWIDNFKLYSTALSEEDLTSDKYAVEADKSALTLPGEVTTDFELPPRGTNGSSISWTVAANDYVTIDGNIAKVTQPANSDEEVTFTAVIKKGTFEDTKEITVKVLKVITDQDVVAKAKAALDIVNKDDVRGNIYLPDELEAANTHKKASITWKSDKPAVVSDKEADGKAAGVVNRQNADTTVTLTAAIQCGDVKETKEIKLTVKKAYELGETTDYLFTYFVANNKASEQIFYASSHDGDNWMDLNKDEAVLYVGDTVRSQEDIAEAKNNPGVRDPYLLRSPEGDKFYLIATDLCVGTQGWDVTSPGKGSRYLRIWESTDLVNWSEPWLGEVAPSDGGNAWAPEAIYDETTGEYVVYWASMTGVDNWTTQRIYYCKTRDFRTFTKPELFIERKDGNGKPYHIIDTTIIKANGKYYRASGDGQITIDASDSLLTGWETIGTLSSIMKNAGIPGSYTGNDLEGPEFYKYNDDDVKKDQNGKPIDTWGLMGDQYHAGTGYLPFKTTDIGDMTGASWSKPNANEYNYDTNRKRHGSVLQLTAEEYDRVMEAYGPSSIKVSAAPAKTTYNKGDTLNAAGLKLEVTYPNGKKETVGYSDNEKNKRHYVFDVTKFQKTGTQKVTVTYGEKSASFDVTVAEGEPEPDNKVLADFTFDDDETGFTSEHAKATGKYKLEGSHDGKALYLDGSADNWLNVTAKDGSSLLTGVEEMTISYEAKPDKAAGNWIMFAAPNANEQIYKSETYLGILEDNGSTKIERYKNNGSRPELNPVVATGSNWVHVDVVVSKTDTTIYVNGEEQARADSAYGLTDILGNSSILYIGKANWKTGEYYKGWIDNFRIENKALSADEVKELADDFLGKMPFELTEVLTGSAPDRETALTYRGTDDHTAIFTEVDNDKKVITPYVRKHADLKKLPVSFICTKDVDEITINGKEFTNGSEADLSKDATVVIKAGKDAQTFTMKKPVISNNPVLPGQYADPDIDYMDGKFWIFPTTDGYPNWTGTVFHAFSSTNMVDWEDEGIIMDLANDNPGKNDKGVQISPSLWAVGSAWAPTIEEKNGKYYFYYCGKDAGGTSAIGVAVADDPAGPYVDKGEALLTVDMVRAAGLSIGQAIDPSIFTDDDGTSYVAFGNGGGKGVLVELNDDMMSVKKETLTQIEGLSEFRESVVITKKDGKYHWTWSCDDANSPNYHVNYGVTDTLEAKDGKINVTLVKKNLLAKDESKGILGSAHQSVVNITDAEGNDRYFMAYHRFYTPLNIFIAADGLGRHRETCIDEIFFDENGYMTIKPTLEGITPVQMDENAPANKTELKKAIDKAKAVDTSKYTEATVKAMNDALKAAEDLMKDDDLTGDDQEKIDAAAKALSDAIDKLEIKKVEDIFQDINADSWYRDYVQYVFDRDIMTGLKKDEFGTDVILTRSHFATMLYRLEGEPNVTYTDRFKDVPDEEFYTNPVMWASDEEVGVISGYLDGNFGPNDPITREQMAVMLYRYAEYKGYDVKAKDDLTRFEDGSKVSEFAKDAMQWAVGAELIKGEGEGDKLNPQGATSRAVCATIMQRFMEANN